MITLSEILICLFTKKLNFTMFILKIFCLSRAIYLLQENTSEVQELFWILIAAKGSTIPQYKWQSIIFDLLEVLGTVSFAKKKSGFCKKSRAWLKM